jgi:hypothetical protein
MHGERAGPLQPQRIAGALVQLEEGIAVACGAVAQADDRTNDLARL